MRLRNRFSYVTLLIGILVFGAPLSATADIFPDAVPLHDIDESRTFHGELKGAPERYTFTLHEQQTFYANLLIPEASGQRKDFLVEVISERGARYAMDGAYFLKWVPFTGPDGRAYLKGPEIAPTIYPGNYTLSVSNIDNHGTYILVLGKAPGGPDVPQNTATALQLANAKPIVFAASAFIAALALALYIRRLLRSRRPNNSIS